MKTDRMLKIAVGTIEHFCNLKENEEVRGCDGKNYYGIKRKGEYLFIYFEPAYKTCVPKRRRR